MNDCCKQGEYPHFKWYLFLDVQFKWNLACMPSYWSYKQETKFPGKLTNQVTYDSSSTSCGDSGLNWVIMVQYSLQCHSAYLCHATPKSKYFPVSLWVFHNQHTLAYMYKLRDTDCFHTRAKCIIWIAHFEWSLERQYFGPCVCQITSRLRHLKCAFQMTVRRCFAVTHLAANHAAKSPYECPDL